PPDGNANPECMACPAQPAVSHSRPRSLATGLVAAYLNQWSRKQRQKGESMKSRTLTLIYPNLHTLQRQSGPRNSRVDLQHGLAGNGTGTVCGCHDIYSAESGWLVGRGR